MNAGGLNVIQIGLLAASGLLLLFALYRVQRVATSQKAGAKHTKMARSKGTKYVGGAREGKRAEIHVAKVAVSVLLESQVDLEIHLRNVGKGSARNVRLLFHGAGYRYEIERVLTPGDSFDESWFTVPMTTNKNRVPEQLSIVWDDDFQENRKITTPIDNPFLVKTMWA